MKAGSGNTNNANNMTITTGAPKPIPVSDLNVLIIFAKSMTDSI
jgi:hypothetical protein